MSQSQTPARYNNSFFTIVSVEQGFRCMVPVGFSLEEALKPGYWTHVARFLKRGFVIQVAPDDWSYIAYLRVIDVGDKYAKVALECVNKLEQAGDDSDLLKVEWSGPHTKFRVLRGKDVLKDGFTDKKLAQRWIDEEYGKKAA